MPETWWLRQQKFILSQSWRLDVQDQGVSGLVFIEASRLACRYMGAFWLCLHMVLPLSVSSVLTWPFLCSNIPDVSSSSHKDISHVGLRPTLHPCDFV